MFTQVMWVETILTFIAFLYCSKAALQEMDVDLM